MTKKAEAEKPKTVEDMIKVADQLTCLRLIAKLQIEILEQLKRINNASS